MSYKKDLGYRDIPFSSETPQEDFIWYDAVSNLNAECESNKDRIIKIRTIGLLETKYGDFYVKQITISHVLSRLPDPRQSIRVSVAHMRNPVRCWSMPHPVQLFGRLQWCNGPLIFAQIIQPLSVSVAIMLNETMARVSTLHRTTQIKECHEQEHFTNMQDG